MLNILCAKFRHPLCQTPSKAFEISRKILLSVIFRMTLMGSVPGTWQYQAMLHYKNFSRWKGLYWCHKFKKNVYTFWSYYWWTWCLCWHCNIGYIPNKEGTDLQKLPKLIQMCSASSNGSKLQWKQKFLYTFHWPRVLS